MSDDEGAGGIPEWVVTFGDMMSLLLTFFIMLVSMSEIKEEEKYQAMVEAIQRQFGYTASPQTVPGDRVNRNSRFTDQATTARSRRQDTMQGGDKTKAPTGENSRVTIVRPGTSLGVGTVIAFDHDQAELNDAQRQQLDQVAVRFEGKPHLIAVAGHSSWQPPSADAPHQDLWALSYARARAVMEDLVTRHDLDRRRIRLQVVGPADPVSGTTGPKASASLDRVEVYLLDETMPPMTDVDYLDR